MRMVPSNTLCAGPDIMTGLLPPSHSIFRSPPGNDTDTGDLTLP